jgi:alkylation response protein AidB-like acyl-CoA dehydrogenase
MNIEHPSKLMNPEWVHVIRSAATEAESAGKLTAEQLSLIYEQQWFKLLVPEIYSGPEMTVPVLVQLEESISWANGSVGWVVTLCAGAGWFGGFFEPDIAKKIFERPDACLAGSGAAMGEALITGDGYMVSGRWPYASGAHHATHFTANCIIKNDEGIVKDDAGQPLVRAFIFDAKDVTISPTWKYMGMMATGTDAFSVENLFVTQEQCFRIDARHAIVTSPLYQYPFLQLAEATIAANLSGMAIHFIDCCKEIFAEKQNQKNMEERHKSLLNSLLIEQENRLNSSRELFYQAINKSWDKMITASIDELSLAEVSNTSKQLAKMARECVDTLYPYCGLIAAARSSEINQVWRDLHTASQHSLLTFAE